MENATLPAGGELTGTVLFYKKPEPLSPEAHGKMGVSRHDAPYAFVSETNLVPLTVAEFPAASLTYPIIFVGDAKTPVVAMGLRPDLNLFLSREGQFRSDAYLPAFCRRYPFVFANDDAAERMILCVDTAAPFVGEKAEVPFFENGKPSAYVENAMQFCNDFEVERRRTESFVELLAGLDLFTTRETVFTPTNPDGTQGEPQKLAEYFAIDEAKLNALPADKFIELRDNGALTHVYAHLTSLLAWDKLIALAIERGQADEAAAAQVANA